MTATSRRICGHQDSNATISPTIRFCKAIDASFLVNRCGKSKPFRMGLDRIPDLPFDSPMPDVMNSGVCFLIVIALSRFFFAVVFLLRF